MSALLSLRGLSVSIAGKQVCRDLDLDFEAGQCVGLLGGNGVGKTTLLHTLAGLRLPDAGTISIAGKALETLSRKQVAQKLGLLMQQHEDPFPASVLDTALIGRHPHIGFWQWESPQDLVAAHDALRITGLTGLESRDIHSLSGGERRRLAIATVLAQQPDIFLLDEPADQLDIYYQMNLLKFFREMAERENRLVLMCLHDMNQAARFCEQVLLMYGDGETQYDTTYKVLTPANLERLYRIPVRMITTEDTLFFQPD